MGLTPPLSGALQSYFPFLPGIPSGGSGSGVSNVTATLPIISSGGTNPNISLQTPLPVIDGGTGTTIPSLIAGTNVTITGAWPDQTINSTSGVGTVTAVTGSGNILSSGGTTPNITTVSSPTFPGLVTASSGISTTTVVASSSISAASASFTAPLPVSSGGTGSATQNFVDLTTVQSVGGAKTFTAALTASALLNANAGIDLMGGSTNLILYNINGTGFPTFTSRSVGTKIALFPDETGSTVDYGIGIGSSTLWESVPNSAAQFQWYAGTTAVATLSGAGALSLATPLAVLQGGTGTTTPTLTAGTNVTLSGTWPNITINASSSGGSVPFYIPGGTLETPHNVFGQSTFTFAMGVGLGLYLNAVTLSGSAAYTSSTTYGLDTIEIVGGTVNLQTAYSSPLELSILIVSGSSFSVSMQTTGALGVTLAGQTLIVDYVLVGY